MARSNYTKLTNERTLLQLTAEGSREAFATLYSHYYPGLYRFVAFVITSPEDSEEIVQDVFLKLWQKKETLVGIRSFDDYLFRMAKNRVFDAARQAKTRLKLQREVSGQLPEATDSTYNNLLFREYHDIAQQAINLLPPRKREMFLMNARDEMTALEIADALGISRAAVKKQLFEAAHFIKDHLRKNAGWLLLFLFLISGILFLPR